jgi:uncharacterized repeat protein (TIGR02543 family)
MITLVLVAATVSAGLIGAVSFATPTETFVPDWTGVSHDFFTLSSGTANPVLTKADVTDRTNVTFVADPFLFHEGSTWYMFFEIMTDGNELHCDIGLATSSDGFHWTYQQVVLDEPFHLAYPQVFKWDGTYYMIPDTYSQDQVKLYKATNFPYAWAFVANIASGPRYVDSSIFRYNNTWWLFTSNWQYSTYLYYSDNLTDPSSWHSHPMNPIISVDGSKARCGGRVTVFNGNTIIRLAQKCNVVYGQAVRAFQVDTLTSTAYAEHEIPQSPIVQASGSGWNKDGMHTVDPWWIGDRWLAAVDGVNYSPSGVWSIGIYVSPVVEYPLTMSTNYGTVSPASGMYDAGSTVTITATPPAAGPGEQYVFLGWTGSGVGSYTGLDNPASVTMNDAITETASWAHQYQLTMTANFGTTSPAAGSTWYNAGATVTISATAPSAGSGERYVWSGWTGSGTGSYTGPSNSATVTMNGSVNETASWAHQYYLTVSSPYGTTSGQGWYNSGATAYAGLNTGTVSGGTGTQYVFSGWSGDASGTNYAQSNSITMNAPKTATANWKTQYYLTVTSAYGTAGGAGWYDSGTSAYATVTPLTVAGANGTQYAFSGWGGDASGINSQSNPIVMKAAATATAIYRTQYYINVTSAHGDPTPSAWVDAGTDFSVSVTSPADTVSDDHRFVCAGCSADGGALNTGTSYDLTDVTAAHTIVFSWKQQFWVVFTQEDLPEDLTANVTVGSVRHSLPYSDWFDQGATVEFTYDGQLPSGFGTQYVLSSTSNASLLKVESSSSVEGSYVKQYTIEMYAVIAVPIILVCLAAAIILLRRRRKSRTAND